MMERIVPEMTPEQEERLRRAIRRCDARNNAYWQVEDHPVGNAEVQEDMLDELRTLREEARAEVDRLKKEYGFYPF